MREYTLEGEGQIIEQQDFRKPSSPEDVSLLKDCIGSRDIHQNTQACKLKQDESAKHDFDSVVKVEVVVDYYYLLTSWFIKNENNKVVNNRWAEKTNRNKKVNEVVTFPMFWF